MSNEEKLAKEIREMAHLTILSGRLNQLQEKNLYMYPMVFFNGVKTVRMDYDLLQAKPSESSPVVNNSRIDYHLDIDESQPNGNMEMRFSSLENSVRSLLWNDISISVYFNDKVVFSSRPNERRSESTSS